MEPKLRKVGVAVFDEEGDPLEGFSFLKGGDNPDIFPTKAVARSFIRQSPLAGGRPYSRWLSYDPVYRCDNCGELCSPHWDCWPHECQIEDECRYSF
jgi:hypothetical protein